RGSSSTYYRAAAAGLPEGIECRDRRKCAGNGPEAGVLLREWMKDEPLQQGRLARAGAYQQVGADRSTDGAHPDPGIERRGIGLESGISADACRPAAVALAGHHEGLDQRRVPACRPGKDGGEAAVLAVHDART